MDRRRLYLLSGRQAVPYPAQGCVAECEDVFAELLGAAILIPASEPDAERVLRDAEPGSDLLVMGLAIGHVVRMLRAMPGWRSRFDHVWAYVFDSALPAGELTRPAWRRRISRFSGTIASLDHLFVSCRSAVEVFASRFPIPVSYVPLAADVAKFGTCQPLRPISVNAYGRQQQEHVQALARAFNSPGSERACYYTSHATGFTVTDMQGHRAFFWKMLSLSRIALAYDILRVKGGRDLPFTFVGQRWFESLAAGCVVVGYRPECVEADELLDWHDATIQCPEDTHEFVAFVEHLLRDTKRLDAARLRNVARMAAAHDWSHRVGAMCTILGLAPTAALEQRRRVLASAERRATQIEAIEAA